MEVERVGWTDATEVIGCFVRVLVGSTIDEVGIFKSELEVDNKVVAMILEYVINVEIIIESVLVETEVIGFGEPVDVLLGVLSEAAGVRVGLYDGVDVEPLVWVWDGFSVVAGDLEDVVWVIGSVSGSVTGVISSEISVSILVDEDAVVGILKAVVGFIVSVAG